MIIEYLNILGAYIGNHKDLIFTFSVLLATIYIPLVIMLLQEINNKLDLVIFFEKRFNLKFILFLYTSIFIVLLFWSNIETNYLYVLLFLLVLIPLYLLIKMLLKLNDFFLVDTKVKDNERINFLRKIDLDNSNKEIWESVFKMDFFSDFQNINDFTNLLFSKVKNKIDGLKKLKTDKEKYETTEQIRSILNAYNDKIDTSLLYAFFDGHSKNLEVFFDLYKSIYKKNNSNYLWLDGDWDNILQNKLEKLPRDNYGIDVFYQFLNKHLDENKNNEEYVKSFTRNLLEVYFRSDELLLKKKLVKNYPFSIDIETFKDDSKQKVLFDIVLNYIVDDIQGHYMDDNIEFNDKIDNILNYWFKDFEIITLSKILFILFVPDEGNRAEAILNGTIRFGHVSRLKTYIGGINGDEVENQNKNEYETTIKNFKILFANLINKKQLKEIIKQFEEIEKHNYYDEKTIKKANKYKGILIDLIK